MWIWILLAISIKTLNSYHPTNRLSSPKKKREIWNGSIQFIHYGPESAISSRDVTTPSILGSSPNVSSILHRPSALNSSLFRNSFSTAPKKNLQQIYFHQILIYDTKS